MTYTPFERLHELYLEYATWLDEFHFQHYVDQFTAYLNRYEPLFSSRTERNRNLLFLLSHVIVNCLG